MKKKSVNYLLSGKALAKAREKAGLTQEDLADAVDLDRVTITGWELKESFKVKEPKMAILRKLLDISNDNVLTYSPDTGGQDILNNPVLRSLVAQSEYIMERVRALEEENKRLRGGKENKPFGLNKE